MLPGSGSVAEELMVAVMVASPVASRPMFQKESRKPTSWLLNNGAVQVKPSPTVVQVK